MDDPEPTDTAELSDDIEHEGEEPEPWKLTKSEWDQLTAKQRETLERLERLETGKATTSQTPSPSPKLSESEKPAPPQPTEELAVETVQVEAVSDQPDESPPDENPADHEKPLTPSQRNRQRKRKRLF